MLSNLKSLKTKGNRKRVGRGMGSGKGGHTVGRGQKGQKSRSGYSRPRPGFEGGSMPLSRRIPKLKGFSRGSIKGQKQVITINFNDLNKFKSGNLVDPKALRENNIVRIKSKNYLIKLLAKGDLSVKIDVSEIVCSKAAKTMIEKKGGKVLTEKV